MFPNIIIAIAASSQQVATHDLKVGLGDVKIKDYEIKVGINLQNTTDDVLHFFTDQETTKGCDIQLDANMFLTD